MPIKNLHYKQNLFIPFILYTTIIKYTYQQNILYCDDQEGENHVPLLDCENEIKPSHTELHISTQYTEDKMNNMHLEMLDYTIFNGRNTLETITINFSQNELTSISNMWKFIFRAQKLKYLSVNIDQQELLTDIDFNTSFNNDLDEEYYQQLLSFEFSCANNEISGISTFIKFIAQNFVNLQNINFDFSNNAIRQEMINENLPILKLSKLNELYINLNHNEIEELDISQQETSTIIYKFNKFTLILDNNPLESAKMANLFFNNLNIQYSHISLNNCKPGILTQENMYKQAEYIQQIYFNLNFLEISKNYDLTFIELNKLRELHLHLHNLQSQYLDPYRFIQNCNNLQQINLTIDQPTFQQFDLRIMNIIYKNIQYKFSQQFKFKGLYCNLTIEDSSQGIDFHKDKCYINQCDTFQFYDISQNSTCSQCSNQCTECVQSQNDCFICKQNEVLKYNKTLDHYYCSMECNSIIPYCLLCTVEGTCLECSNGGNPLNNCLCDFYNYGNLTQEEIIQESYRCFDECIPTCKNCVTGYFNICEEGQCVDDEYRVQINGRCGCKEGKYISEVLPSYGCAKCNDCEWCENQVDDNYLVLWKNIFDTCYDSTNDGIRSNNNNDDGNDDNNNKGKFLKAGVIAYIILGVVMLAIFMVILLRKKILAYILKKKEIEKSKQYKDNSQENSQNIVKNNNNKQNELSDEEIQQLQSIPSKRQNQNNININQNFHNDSRQKQQSIMEESQGATIIVQNTDQNFSNQQLQQQAQQSNNTNIKNTNIINNNNEIDQKHFDSNNTNSQFGLSKFSTNYNTKNSSQLTSDFIPETNKNKLQIDHQKQLINFDEEDSNDEDNQSDDDEEEYQTIRKNQKKPKKNQVQSLQEFDKKYEKQFIIGKGMFGKVYQIQEKYTQKLYALKQIKTINEEENKIINCELEVYKHMQNHTHPNVTHAIDLYYGTSLQQKQKSQQTLYKYLIVMEKGQFSLQEYLTEKISNNEQFSIQEIKHLFQQSLAALQHFQSLNMNHRDIKPQNIIIMDDYSIKFTDFGVSKISDNYMKTYQSLSLAQGTPCYMSPEMYQKMKNLQELPFEQVQQQSVQIDYLKSDIYSLGLTILQVVNQLQVVDLVGINCNQDMQILQKQLEKIQNEQLKFILEGMLQYDFHERFQLDLILDMVQNI